MRETRVRICKVQGLESLSPVGLSPQCFVGGIGPVGKSNREPYFFRWAIVLLAIFLITTLKNGNITIELWVNGNITIELWVVHRGYFMTAHSLFSAPYVSSSR